MNIREVTIRLSRQPIPKEKIRHALENNQLGMDAKGLYFLLATTHDTEGSTVYEAKSLLQFTTSTPRRIILALDELSKGCYLLRELNNDDTVTYTVREDDLYEV